LPVLLKSKINIKFLFASLKILINSKICSKSRVKFLFWLSLLSLVYFLPVYIHGRLSEQFSETQATFGTTFEPQATIGKAEKVP
jgi:hypothetical protein